VAVVVEVVELVLLDSIECLDCWRMKMKKRARDYSQAAAAVVARPNAWNSEATVATQSGRPPRPCADGSATMTLADDVPRAPPPSLDSARSSRQ
jgi:hypothetical protein